MKTKIMTLLPVILLLAVGTCGCPKKDRFSEFERKTLDSFTKAADGIYVMDYYANYKIEEYLSANIKTVTELDTWLTKNLTYGVPTGNIPDTGCSSFATKDSEGNHLFGRNYDLIHGESLVIRVKPWSGYASLGVVDLMHLNLGSMGEYKIEDKDNREALLLAAPWCISDGINEMGLGASILELSEQHVVNDTSKKDLLMYTTLRVVLDKCANVDEALALLANYDMYSPRKNSYHFFLTDTTRRAVVVEWDAEGKMVTTEDTAVTNFIMYNGAPMDPDQRYRKMHDKLDSVSAMTSSEAMELLETVNKGTLQEAHWSAVYNLEKFSVKVCFNEDYSNVYSYTGTKSEK